MDGLMGSPLGSLPHDVLELILLLLTTQAGGCTVRATCKPLRDGFDGCNTRLVLGGASPPSTGDAGPSEPSAEQPDRELLLLPALLRRTPGLASLRFKPWAQSDLWRGAVHLPTLQLRHLDLTATGSMPAGGSSALSRLLGSCSTLLSLRLRHCCEAPSLPFFLPALRTPTLEQLRLSDSCRLSSLSCLTHLVGLQELALGECLGLTDLSPLAACSGLHSLSLTVAPLLSLLSASALTSLTRLTFACLNGGGRSLAPLTPLPRLRHLDLSLSQRDTILPKTRLLLAPLPALQHLALTHCGLSDLTPLTACPALHTLDLALCQLPAGGGGGGEGVSALCRCSQLASLHLSMVNGLEGEELAQVKGALSARGVSVKLFSLASLRP